MSREKIAFEAHKEVKQPMSVGFTTRNGQFVHFVANKPVKVPVQVSFMANRGKKK